MCPWVTTIQKYLFLIQINGVVNNMIQDVDPKLLTQLFIRSEWIK